MLLHAESQNNISFVIAHGFCASLSSATWNKFQLSLKFGNAESDWYIFGSNALVGVGVLLCSAHLCGNMVVKLYTNTP